MTRRTARTGQDASGPIPVEAIEHLGATRTNIPTADSAEHWADPAAMARDPDEYKRALDFAAERTSRNEALDPQLVWHGKDEQDDHDLIVQAPPLYIQEKIDPRALIENLRRTAKAGQREPEMLFYDDFDGDLDELQQIDYYQHKARWSNRMILGDSLQAMGSLAKRENLRGKVQMVYIDPPYGIRFNSNWQVSARQRDVRDGKDTAREVEQIKAFRDTWKDGIHTYLSYLRDRLVVSRELLTQTGSIFVQIGEENVHRVRALMDEVFRAENFVSQISFVTTSGFSQATALGRSGDYLLWYAYDIDRVKARTIYRDARERQGYGWVHLPDGSTRSLTARERSGEEALPAGARRYKADNIQSQGAASADQAFAFRGKTYRPGSASHWKANFPMGMERLADADRIHVAKNSIQYIRYEDDFGYQPFNNTWTDTATGSFTEDKVYVVQTSTKVIERCLLMTTDPGDLVLDPTCGSGSTAFTAEQWGRRWITMDTSRVALTLTRQRLMTARFPYYLLASSAAGRHKEAELSGSVPPATEAEGDVSAGFVYQRARRVTLGSIANNPDIHGGMHRTEIEAAIARHTEFEELYDRPFEDPQRVRVTGRFTVETLSPHRSLDQRDASRSERVGETDPSGADHRQTVLENLRTAGIQNGRRQERIEFASLDAHAGTHVQAIGELRDAGHHASRIAIAIGPEYGTVSPGFVRDAAREALRDAGVDMLCVLGFSFDPGVSNVTEVDGVTLDKSDDGFANVEGERTLGRLKVLIVRMNAELLMGDALKKTGAGNLFTVFGEPDVEIRADGDRLQVELRGVDVYDAGSGEVRAADTSQVALWMIDTDYDEESFFVRHCYFTGGGDPMKRLKVALKADIDADAWEQLYRTTSMSFDRPATGKIAVKVINDYGDEVTKVYDV